MILLGYYVDIAGQRFGKLVAIRPTDKRDKWSNVLWECQCDCGNIYYTPASGLRKGNTKSCGCSRRVPRPNRKKTDYCGTRIYRVWANMKTRCLNSNQTYRYSRYGGRGITICDEWMEFKPFLEWALSSGYSEELTLDRVNNDDGYNPDNCRWVPMSVQNKNRSSTHWVTINGETKCVKDWKKELHKDYYGVLKLEDENGKHTLAEAK